MDVWVWAANGDRRSRDAKKRMHDRLLACGPAAVTARCRSCGRPLAYLHRGKEVGQLVTFVEVRPTPRHPLERIPLRVDDDPPKAREAERWHTWDAGIATPTTVTCGRCKRTVSVDPAVLLTATDRKVAV